MTTDEDPSHSASSDWTDNARVVLEARYLARDEGGRLIETPAQMLERVARALAAPDASYGLDPDEAAGRFLDRMRRRELLPNSPTLMNAGRPLGQLAACFVLPVEDSMPGIFETLKSAALIQMSGGGTGFAFSRLRPAGDRVDSTQGVASGPVSFMEVFKSSTEAIRQGGTSRRGANMGILRVDHPDVLEFCASKAPGTSSAYAPAGLRLRNFNISVAITDEFMRAVDEGRSYALVNPRTGVEVRRLEARAVLDAIARYAWASGEPGAVFIDRMNEGNPTPRLADFEATNPCGEIPLLPFEACNLASIDVSRFVDEKRGDFHWTRLASCVRDGIHLLDNVIDANRYPLAAIASATRRTRKVGLGVMGFADALIRLGIPYDSDEAIGAASRLMEFISERAHAASADLAVERGAFPAFVGSRWDLPSRPGQVPGTGGARRMRNATCTTVAPTGTISILAGCSSGIEPLYALSFVRRVLDGERLLEVHPGFVARARAEGFFSDALMEAIARTGSVRSVGPEFGVPDEVCRLYPTAYDVDPRFHVRMQAAFQAHVDNAVSKTINCRHETTPEQVAGLFLDAYRLGCKGVTVFRDGSRPEQVLAFGPAAESATPAAQCPGCGAGPVVPQASCTICLSCGHSSCG